MTINQITVMKKILVLLSVILCATSCVFFEQDNYEGPNATVNGRFIDSKTKENVPMECKFGNFFGGAYFGSPTVGYISVFELGWDYEQAQYWHIRYDGSYTNTMVFSGKYRLECNADNFYPVTKDNVEFKKGDNTLDWEVTPYARVIDPKVEFVGGKFVATFKCEVGDPTKANTILDAKLLCYQDNFVGIYCNNCGSDPGASSNSIVADGKTVNTLTIDPSLDANKPAFPYVGKGKSYYFRIAVLAGGNGANPTKAYNYSPSFKIQY